MNNLIQNKFLQYLISRNVSALTLKNYRSDLSHFSSWIINKIKAIGSSCEDLQEALPFITKATASEYKDYLVKASVPAKTINRRLSTLRTLSRFFLEEDLLGFDFTSGIENITSTPLAFPVEKSAKEFEAYLATEKISPVTIKNYAADINQFARWTKNLGKKEMKDIVSKDIKRYLVLEFSEAPQATVDRKTSSLKKFFNWAREKQIIEVNPIDGFLKDTAYLKPLTRSLDELTTKKIERSVFGIEPSYKTIQDRIIARFAEKPKLQKVVYKLFYTRPKWYQAYHSLAITRYFHFAILVVFAASLGFGIYQQFFSKAKIQLAYPETPVTPNRYLSFQGRLTNQYNTPVTDSSTIKFELYDDETETGPTHLLWDSSDCEVVPDQDGIFNVLLGTTTGEDFSCPSATAIGADVFSENAGVWLQMTTETETMDPRVQIATVAYALNADTVQGFPITATVSATKSSIVVMDKNGQVVLGEVGPTLKSVAGNFAIEGQTITLQTAATSNGDINLSPNGTGSVNITSSAQSDDTLYVTNAQTTTGAVIHGYYGGVATDVNLLRLGAGASETDKFVVKSNGDTTIASGADYHIGTIGLGDVGIGSTSSGASLVGLYDDAMVYVSDTTVQGAIKQLDTALGSISDASGWKDDGDIVRLVTSGNRVGIGTTSVHANTKLGVLGAAAIGSQTYSDAAAPTNGLIVEGQVGIGVTAINSANEAKVEILQTNTTPYGLYVTNTGGSTGIYGYANFAGNGTGVVGEGPTIGVSGSGTGSGTGVSGSSESGIGVYAAGSTFDFYANTSGAKNYFAGNTGIGTTSPGTKLGIVGGVGVGTTDSFANAAIAANNLAVQGNVGIGTTSPLGSLDVRSGNVGIGTTMAATQKLDIQGNMRLTGALYDTNNEAGTSTQILSSTGSGVDWVDIGTIGISGTGTTNYIPRWASSSSLTNSSIYDDGTNVGIGTTVPATSLHVASDSTSSTRGITFTQSGTIHSAKMVFQKSRGTVASPSTVATSDYVSSFGFAPYTTTSGFIQTAGFGSYVDGTVTSTTAPTSIYFYTGSTENLAPLTSGTRMYINSSGNIGMGTTTPQSLLDIEGGMAIGATYSGTSTSPANGLIVEGNVGVGVTAPRAKLQSAGTISISGGYTATPTGYNGLHMSFDSSNSIGYIWSVQEGTAFRNIKIDGLNLLLQTTAGTGNVGIGTTSPMSGLDIRTANVGIGTTMAATQKLDVQGSVRVTGAYYDSANAAGSSGYYLQSTGTGTSWTNMASVLLPTGTNGQTLYNLSGAWTATSNLFNDGTNVGIGTTVPTSKLAVQGTQSTATLGTSIITNGDFASSLSGWTDSGSNWAYSSGTALHTAGVADTLSQSVSITNGYTYQVSFTIAGLTAGNISVSLGSVSVVNYGTTTTFGSNTTIVRSLVATDSTGSVNFTVTPSSDFNGSIDNISVQRITLGSALASTKIFNDDGTSGLELRSGGSSLLNTTVGYAALDSNTTGYANVSLGYYSLSDNTTGYLNTALGYGTLASNTNGFSNTASGYYAMRYNNTGYNNNAYGYTSLYNNTTGTANTAIGMNSMVTNASGSYNTAIGNESLRTNSSANYNTAVGNYSLYSTTGSNNSALGYYSLYSNSSGTVNVAVGDYAMRYPATGSYNVAVGTGAGYGASGGSDISNNTLLGYHAGYGLLTGGDSNTILGYNAGDNLTTGATNIIIGSGVDALSATNSNQLNIGNTIYGDLSSDNVGIGATAPDGGLVVGSGNQIAIQINPSSSGYYGIKLKNGSATAFSLFHDDNAGTFDIGYNATATNDISTHAKLLTVNTSGNIGIGTSVPTKGKLNVLGSVAIGSTAYTQVAGAAPTYGLIVEGNIGIGITNPTGKLQISGDEVRIGSGGSIGFATGDGDLYVQDSLEVDGTAYFTGDLSFKGEGNKIARAIIPGMAETESSYNAIGVAEDRLVRADEKYTVTVSPSCGAGSTTNLFDGKGDSYCAYNSWSDGVSTSVVTIDMVGGMGAPGASGPLHYWDFFRINMPYSRSVTGVLVEKYYDAGGTGGYVCDGTDNAWGTVYSTSSFSGTSLDLSSNLGNGICGFRVTFSGNANTAPYLWIGEIMAYQNYYGPSGGMYVATTGDTIYGNLQVGTASTSRNIYALGNIGIGTTVPTTALQVGAGASIHSLGAGDTLLMGKLEVAGVAYFDTGIQGAAGGGAIGFRSTTNDVFFNYNVGIGTTSPQTKLGIVGGVGIGTSDSFANAAIAASDLAIQGNVGIGKTNPIGALEISKTYNSASTVYGIYEYLTNTGGGIPVAASITSRTMNTSTGYTTGMGVGTWVTASTVSSSGGQTTAVGARNYFSATSPYTASASPVSAFYATAPYITGTGTVSITNMQGLHVDNMGSSSVTNAYGIYLAAQSGATTNNYGIYSAGGTNYFEGNMGIGITNPTQALTLNGGDIDFTRGDTSLIHSLGGISFDWTSGSYDSPEYHGIESKNLAGNLSSELRMNSYGDLNFTIDSNANGSNTFRIQKESTTDGEDLLTVNETGTLQLEGYPGVGTTGIFRINYSSTDSAYYSQISMEAYNSGTQSLDIVKYGNYVTMTNTKGNWYFTNVTGNDFWFRNTTTTELLYIGSNVGVGTSSPGAKLDVEGYIQANMADVTTGYVVCASDHDGTNQTLQQCDGAGDIAEHYRGDGVLKPGDITSGSSSNSEYLVPSNGGYDANTIGVVSTMPVFKFGTKSGGDILLALNGRVPVKVSVKDLSKPIKNNDKITASSLPGIGMKSEKPGRIVAQALDNTSGWNESTCPQVSSIESISWPEDEDGTNSDKPCYRLPDGTYVGKIMAFLNVSWYDPDVYMANTGDLNIAQISDGSYNAEGTNGTISRIGAFAQVVVANMSAGAVSTKEIVVETSAQITGTLAAGIINATSITTEGFMAVQAEVDTLLVNIGLVSPKVQTAMISPLVNEGNINIQIGNNSDGSDGKLTVENQNGEEVASIDTEGNATFSGELAAKDVTAENTSTNTLTAQKIYADQIVAKDGKIFDLSATNITGVTREEIEAMLQEAEADQELLQTATNWTIETASQAAELANIGTANIENLFVTQSAAMDSLSLTTSLSLGSDMVLSSTTLDGLTVNSIDTLTAPLEIQSLAMAPVEIMSGRIKIDTEGNVTISGNLYVAGKIEAEGLVLSAQNTEEENGSLLTLKNTEGSDIGSVSASGSAEFSQLASRKLVIAGADSATASANTQGEIETNASAGHALLAAQANEITIRSSAVTNKTLVYVTPTTSTQNNVLFVKAKGDGYFKVGFIDAIDQDTEFNWWVIDVGQ